MPVVLKNVFWMIELKSDIQGCQGCHSLHFKNKEI